MCVHEASCYQICQNSDKPCWEPEGAVDCAASVKYKNCTNTATLPLLLLLTVTKKTVQHLPCSICNVSFLLGLIQRHAVNTKRRKTAMYLQFTKNHFSVKIALINMIYITK